MKTDHSRRLLAPILWAVLGLTLVTALLLQARLVANLDFRGENSGSESVGLYALRCARDGKPVYGDYSVPPHVIPQHMPLFYLLPAWVARTVEASDSITFLIGRAEVWASWLGIAVLIYALARQVGCGPGSSSLAALLWLSSQLAHHWAVSFRPDAIALLLVLAALDLYRRQRPCLAVTLLVVAFFHKQSSIAAIGAIVAENYLTRRWQRAALIGGTWLAAVAVGLGASQLWSGGMMARNTFHSLDLFASWQQAVELLRGAMTRGTTALVGGALACIVVRDGASRWLRIYFLFAVALAVATSIKAGAYTNYYLEPFAAGCVLTALFIEDWRQRPAGQTETVLRLGWLGVACAAAMVAAGTAVAQLPSWAAEITRHREMRERERQVLEDVVRELRAVDGALLIEDPYLAIRSSVVPYLVDPSLFAELQRQGKFDDHELVRRIGSGEFTAIVLILPMDDKERLFSERWIAAMRGQYAVAAEHFVPDRRGLTWYVYRRTQ